MRARLERTDIIGHIMDPYAHHKTTGIKSFLSATIDFPSGLRQNPFVLLSVHASRFANGITVTDCGIVTHPSSTYSVDFKNYSSPTDGSPVTIETVATSGSQEAEDNGTIDNPSVAANNIVYVNLPATVIDQVNVWVTFTID